MLRSLETSKRLAAPVIEPTQVLARLRLTAGKAARLCGVTRRQLCYWTDKGIIPCCGGNRRDPSRRIYDFTGLRKAMMLKQLMDEGRGLRRAVRELKARWVETKAEPRHNNDSTPEHALLTQAERLVQLGERARQVAAANNRREALVRLALALQPLASLGEAASQDALAFVSANAASQLQSLLASAERTLAQL